MNKNNHRSLVNFPHKGQWRRALLFSLICAWINGLVNNRKAGDLRRHRVHYEVTVMTQRGYMQFIEGRSLGYYNWSCCWRMDIRGHIPVWHTLGRITCSKEQLFSWNQYEQYGVLCRNNRIFFVINHYSTSSWAVSTMRSLQWNIRPKCAFFKFTVREIPFGDCLFSTCQIVRNLAVMLKCSEQNFKSIWQLTCKLWKICQTFKMSFGRTSSITTALGPGDADMVSELGHPLVR